MFSKKTSYRGAPARLQAECGPCDRIRRRVEQRVRSRAALRVTGKPDSQGSPWRKLPIEVRRREYARQIEIEAKYGGERPKPSTPATFTHPELTRIRAERRAAYKPLDTNEKRHPEGFVYVVVDTNDPGYCKIGYSKDPAARLSSATTFIRQPTLKLVNAFYFPDCRAIEKAVHNAFGHLRDRGEWFHMHETRALSLLCTLHKWSKDHDDTC